MDKINIEKIKCPGKYFSYQDLKTITFSGVLSLCPLDYSVLQDDNDVKVLEMITQDESVLKYIPGFNLNGGSMMKFLSYGCLKAEYGLSFSYLLKYNSMIIGLFVIDTPAFSELHGGHDWMISFCVFKPLEGRGLMSAAMPNLLQYLKTDIGVKQIFAVVDEGNERSANFLAKFCFNKVDNSNIFWSNGNKSKPIRYCCDLENIEF